MEKNSDWDNAMNNCHILNTTAIISLDSPHQSISPVSSDILPNFTCDTTLHIPDTGSTQKVQLHNKYWWLTQLLFSDERHFQG